MTTWHLNCCSAAAGGARGERPRPQLPGGAGCSSTRWWLGVFHVRATVHICNVFVIQLLPAAVPPAAAPGEKDRGPSYLAVLAKAALAGGLASSVSVLALHPIDTLKTRVQSTPGATIRGVAASAPKIGARGLYRGIIPAVGGRLPMLQLCLHPLDR